MVTSRPKVLVVDDQRSMRLTLAGIIEEQGFEVTEVEDGYEAIEVARDIPFDLVFMDIKMPGINGVQTFREIKKHRPDSVVVMMTGFAVEELVREALEEGAFSVIYKPFEIDKIIQLIESALQSLLILVVDDRATDREILRQILQGKGYRVAEAADGSQAIDMVRNSRYDIIFLDIRMPGKDGIETFQEVSEIAPDAKVIFVTGYELEASARRVLDAGTCHVAYKPFDIENILSLAQQMVAS